MGYTVLCLGNPGPRYRETRHNAGFFVAEALSKRLGKALRRPLFGKYRYLKHGEMLVVTPLTYMNRSGEVLPNIDRRFRGHGEPLIVVFDQMDLPPGAIRLKRGGGSGGHRGVESVVQFSHDREWYKLAVGIGRPRAGVSVTDHVLSEPRTDERDALHSACDTAGSVVLRFAEDDPADIMNEVNRRVSTS